MTVEISSPLAADVLRREAGNLREHARFTTAEGPGAKWGKRKIADALELERVADLLDPLPPLAKGGGPRVADE